MAYTSTDLSTVETAILALAAGQRAVQVTLSSGKTIRYAEADLSQLRKLRDEIRSEINSAASRKRYFRTSTYKGL